MHNSWIQTLKRINGGLPSSFTTIPPVDTEAELTHNPMQSMGDLSAEINAVKTTPPPPRSEYESL